LYIVHIDVKGTKADVIVSALQSAGYGVHENLA